MDGTGLLLHERSLRLARLHLRPLAEGSFHWGLWKKLLSSAGCQVPERPARITPAQELKHAETQRQRHKEQFTPDLTRRERWENFFPRHKVTGMQPKGQKACRCGKSIFLCLKQKEKFPMLCPPQGVTSNRGAEAHLIGRCGVGVLRGRGESKHPSP